MKKYRLSKPAKKDLVTIARFGVRRFGVNQSNRYRDRLIRQCATLAERPLLFAAVDHIRPGYRRCVCGAHSIYYRVDERGVEIIRILNRQDLARAF